jgi:transcriptional regulator with XRE-family HTH domain
MRSSKHLAPRKTVASALVTRARIRAGMSQRELAEAAGVAQSTIARIESGVADPAFSTIERILAAVGLEMRIRIEPTDDHDQVLESLHALLSPDERERAERRHESNVRKFADAGRRARL